MESRTGEDALLERIEALENQLRLAEAFHGGGFWMLLDRIEELTLKGRQISCIVCGFRDDSGGFRMHTDRCIFGGGALRRFECPECDAIFGPMKYLDLDDELVARDYRYAFTRFHTLFLTGRSPHVLAERTGFSASPVPAGNDTLCHIFRILR